MSFQRALVLLRLLIPVDLYENIFSNLSQSDLFTLCTVSTAMHREAERILYVNVDLTLCDGEKVLLWCRRMSESPRIARMVRQLCLPWAVSRNIPFMSYAETDSVSDQEFGLDASAKELYEDGNGDTDILDEDEAEAPDSTFLDQLMQAMQSLVNLRALSTGDSYRSWDEPADQTYILEPSIFKDCSFLLRKCHLDFLIRSEEEESELLQFYSKQPGIIDWAPGVACPSLNSPTPSSMFLSNVTRLLYRLRALVDGGSGIPFLATKNIQHICITTDFQFDENDGLQLVERILALKGTLIDVCLEFSPGAKSEIPSWREYLTGPGAKICPNAYKLVDGMDPSTLVMQFRPDSENFFRFLTRLKVADQ